METHNSTTHPDLSTPWSQRRAEPGPPFDRQTLKALITTLQIVLLGGFSILGLVSNIINVFIFYLQGILTDSSTVTLTALAVADFASCLLNLWSSVLTLIRNHVDESQQWSWDVRMFYFFTSARPRATFVQITCWVTAYLAFERFFSVVFPFKIKSVFSPKRSVVVLVCINLGTIILYFSYLVSEKPVWQDRGNRSVLTYDYSHYFPPVMRDVHLYLNALVLHTLAVAVVILCNVAIFWKVYLSQKFRKTAAHSGKSPNQNQSDGHTSKVKDADSVKGGKERNLLRMIMTICLLFVVCYIPDVCLTMLNFAVAKTQLHQYESDVTYAFSHLMETINSSCNLFIYYNLSSRYREEFRRVFCRSK